MYNTKYKVKYYQIERDLIDKLSSRYLEKKEAKQREAEQNKNENSSTTDNNLACDNESFDIDEYIDDDNEYEYTANDVLTICHKLYKDELLSVFDVEDLNDDRIDGKMRYVYSVMMQNPKFKDIIYEMTELSINLFNDSENLSDEKHETLRHIILITLFSQHIFYIMHQCICQQIETGNIDDDLLVNLKSHSLDALKNHHNNNNNNDNDGNA
jgi:hypothetical protein